jgi:hypothetical protein
MSQVVSERRKDYHHERLRQPRVQHRRCNAGRARDVALETAYVNPDVAVTGDLGRRRPHNGPSLSIAGAMPGGPTASWRTAYPDGESIYVAELRNAEARAALPRREAQVVSLPTRTRRVVPQAKAA